MLPIKGNGYVSILRNFSHSEKNDDDLLTSYEESLWHKDVLLQIDESCISLKWLIQPSLGSILELWDSINDFTFFCRVSTDTGKWRSFIIRIQLNNSLSTKVGYDNGLPAPLVFPFHAFFLLKPPCLFIFDGPALHIFLFVQSSSLNARVVSR